MKNVTLFSLMIVLLLSTSAIAQNKVVVIPLNSTTYIDNWVRVFDDNNAFVGFSTVPYTTGPGSKPLISAKNFYSSLMFIPPDNFRFFLISTTYSFDPTCTGKRYHATPYLLDEIGEGQVFDLVTSATLDASAYYTLYSTPFVEVASGESIYVQNYTTPCTSTTAPSDLYFYELLPNDVVITGFKESKLYETPFSYQYTLPKTP